MYAVLRFLVFFFTILTIFFIAARHQIDFDEVAQVGMIVKLLLIGLK